jgi:hypothetical protein
VRDHQPHEVAGGRHSHHQHDAPVSATRSLRSIRAHSGRSVQTLTGVAAHSRTIPSDGCQGGLDAAGANHRVSALSQP